MMHREEAEDALNMVTYTFSTQAQPIHVLFNCGITHSFNSVKLVKTPRLVPRHRLPLLFSDSP